MQPGELIDAEVQSYTSRVTVNGVLREFLSWSTDREISSDLPVQVSGGSGTSQATGEIEWASEDVDAGGLNPWNTSTGWIPLEGDIVRIYVSDGSTEWQQFEGVVDKTSGTIGGGISSSLIDRTDDFSNPVSIPALVAVMPPLEPSGLYRRFRLMPRWYVMMAARAAGFYATPAPENNPTIDVPAFGSMWPVVGEAITCHKGSNSDGAPEFPNGTHVADLSMRLNPWTPRPYTRAVQLTMNIAEGHTGVASLTADYGGQTVTLRATNANVLLMINGSTVLSVPRSGGCVAVGWFENGQARLRTSEGQDVSGAQSWSATGNMTEARIAADSNSLVNGFHISHPTSEGHLFSNLNWEPTALIASGAMHDAMLANRGATGSASELLDEISSSLLWPYWIDENGIFRAVQSDLLRNGDVVRNLTTADDIFELGWERSLLSMRSRIEAEYDVSAVTRQRNHSTQVWEGETVILQSGEEHEQFIEASGDEAWLLVDESPSPIHLLENITEFNRGVGSVYGGVYTDGTNELWATAPSVNKLTVQFQQITPNTWKVTHKAGSLDPGWQVELRTWSSNFTGNTALWPYAWGRQLPIFAAKGKAVFSKRKRSPVVLGNSGPTYTHECGSWATGHLPETETRVVDEIVNFLSDQLVNPQPVITGLRVRFDPRIQLGDVISVKSENYMGTELRCLVVGVSIAAGANGYSMDLSVRVIRAQSMFATYEEFEKAWGNTANYSAFETVWGMTATYQDFNADPLRGTN